MKQVIKKELAENDAAGKAILGSSSMVGGDLLDIGFVCDISVVLASGHSFNQNLGSFVRFSMPKHKIGTN